MYEFFKHRPVNTRGNIVLPQYLYIRRGLVQELQRVWEFYHRNPTAVHSDHIVVTLLNSIPLNANKSVQAYVDTIRDLTYSLAMATGLTSPFHRGRVHEKHWFYSKGTKEIIVMNTDDFDTTTVLTDWRSLEPIKVLRHDMTGIDLPILDGKPGLQDKGYAVISINLPMLAAQYREFLKTQDSKNSLPATAFARMYPITNMCASHLEYAIFNRLNALFHGYPIAPRRKYHTFILTDFSDKLDPLLEQFLEIATDRKPEFGLLLEQFPSVTSKDMFDVLTVPDFPPVRQVEWALNFARLPAVAFLLHIDAYGGNKGTRNLNTKNHWRLDIRDMLSDKSMAGALGANGQVMVLQYLRNQILAYT